MNNTTVIPGIAPLVKISSLPSRYTANNKHDNEPSNTSNIPRLQSG